MLVLRTLALLVPLSLAVAPAPAGNDGRGCIVMPVADPEIGAFFAKLERDQSTGAARICAMFRNDASRGGIWP